MLKKMMLMLLACTTIASQAYASSSLEGGELAVDGEALTGMLSAVTTYTAQSSSAKAITISCPFGELESEECGCGRNSTCTACGGTGYVLGSGSCSGQLSFGSTQRPGDSVPVASTIATKINCSYGELALDLSGRPQAATRTAYYDVYSFQVSSAETTTAQPPTHLSNKHSGMVYIKKGAYTWGPIADLSAGDCQFGSSRHYHYQSGEYTFCMNGTNGSSHPWVFHLSSWIQIIYTSEKGTSTKTGTQSYTYQGYKGDNSITSVVFKNCKTDGVNLSPL